MIMFVYYTFTRYKTTKMSNIITDIICEDIHKWEQNGYAILVYCGCFIQTEVFCKRCHNLMIDFYKGLNDMNDTVFMTLNIVNLSFDNIVFIHPIIGFGSAHLDNQLLIRGRYFNEKLFEYNDLVNFLRKDFTQKIPKSDSIDILLDTYIEDLSRFEFIRNLFGNTQKDEEIIIEI